MVQDPKIHIKTQHTSFLKPNSQDPYLEARAFPRDSPDCFRIFSVARVPTCCCIKLMLTNALPQERNLGGRQWAPVDCANHKGHKSGGNQPHLRPDQHPPSAEPSLTAQHSSQSCTGQHTWSNLLEGSSTASLAPAYPSEVVF